MKERLKLQLHPHKRYFQEIRNGLTFCGVRIHPYYITPRMRTIGRRKKDCTNEKTILPKPIANESIFVAPTIAIWVWWNTDQPIVWENICLNYYQFLDQITFCENILLKKYRSDSNTWKRNLEKLFIFFTNSSDGNVQRSSYLQKLLSTPHHHYPSLQKTPPILQIQCRTTSPKFACRTRHYGF